MGQCLGLGLLGLLTLVAMGQELVSIIVNKTISLGDLLLLFIYLEVLAMVRTQLVSGEIPLSMPFAIAIVALSRYLVLDLKAMDQWQVITIAAAMLLLTLALVALRYWKNAKRPHEVSGTSTPP
jgi:protein PsiE